MDTKNGIFVYVFIMGHVILQLVSYTEDLNQWYFGRITDLKG